jgi:hypothetical protein
MGLIGPLTMVSSGITNTMGWYDNFENYTNFTPLINGTQGWFASSANAVVTTNYVYGGSGQAAMIPVDVTLSNRFSNSFTRIVNLQMYIRPQMYNGTSAPVVARDVAAQFYINSNGYFVVCNGTNWNIVSRFKTGGNAIAISNNYFTKVKVNLRYKNHTWNLQAWSNDTLPVANTPYMNFTSNLDSFSGFAIYNGASTSYVDNILVTNVDQVIKINGVRFDAIYRIDNATPFKVNGVME